MKCPICGNELRRSKKDPSYGLCDRCRKKIKWMDDVNEDDYDEVAAPEPGYKTKDGGVDPQEDNAPSKRRKGCIVSIIALIVVIIIVVITVHSCASGSKAKKEAKNKAESQEEMEGKKADAQAADLEKLVNSSLSDGMAKVKEYGFTATYRNMGTDADMTDIIAPLSADEASAYTIMKVTALGYDKTVEMYIASEADKQAIKMEKTLSEKLETGYAWSAVKDYGEAQYPYGFKLHYLVGAIAQEPSDENTWFLKADCDVTNEFGATAKMTCEAHVTGTTEAPQVVDFNVY